MQWDTVNKRKQAIQMQLPILQTESHSPSAHIPLKVTVDAGQSHSVFHLWCPLLRVIPRREVGHQQQHTTRPLHGSTHNILADHKRVFQSIRCIIRWIEIVECGYDCGKDSVYSSNDEEGPRCEEDIERWMDALADSRLPTV